MVFDTFIVAFIAKAASLIACGLSLIPPGAGKAKIGTLDETPKPEAPAELEVTESSQDLGLVTGPPFEGPSHLEIRFKLVTPKFTLPISSILSVSVCSSKTIKM